MALTKIIIILLLSPILLHALSTQGPETLPTPFEETLIQQACVNTTNSAACVTRIRAECSHSGGLRGPLPVMHAAIRGTIDEARRAAENVSDLAAISDDLREQTAIGDCTELLDRTVLELSWSLSEMARVESGGSVRRQANLRSWMSAALGNQDTCLDGFHGTDGRLRRYVYPSMVQVNQLVANLLELGKRMHGILPHEAEAEAEPPYWVGPEEEEMMRADPSRMSLDAVVAQDGTGRYRTINEAVNAAPSHSKRRYVILVKRGVYRENVELKKKKSNIMLVGEGMGLTVITGSRSFVQGWTTYRTATFAVSGQRFIARDITFRNTAGPQNRQAVAIRVDSDRSAFYRCAMEGYQDTLYAHSLRQFYRECHIYGTIDFIFGNGQAVFQSCKIYTRKPLPYQKVTITAHGRKDANQNTGFSIHNSYVYATYPSYLGRPWKAYSRTVFMQTYLGDGVQPAGWLAWYGNFALSTLFYGEYRNYGPGSGLSNRITWPGYHAIQNENLASFFTVRRFIDGTSWLPATGVPFTADLIS